MPPERQMWKRDRPDEPHVFPPGPSRAHPAIPLGRGWRIAGVIIGAIIVLLVAAVIGGDPDDESARYESIIPSAIVTDPAGPSGATAVQVQIDRALPSEGRVKVSGDDLVRVDVSGDALCASVSGAAGAWIDVRFCEPLESLDVVGFDVDDVATVLIAEF